MKFLSVSVGLILMFSQLNIVAQKGLPRLSPKSYIGQTIGYTNVEVTYSSPGVKERNVWGELVPYNEVWRTGANEATTIEFDNDILVEGKKIPAGKYSLFTIPGKNKWVIIFNKIYEQWGAFKYNKEEDFIRFSVTPKQNSFVERLRFTFEFKEPYVTTLNLEWEKVKVSFNINTEIKE
ncbi:MAG: DUF2911 domain-containing protein [Ignavibacteriales bacterium]|nr:DUF2911 domain-containing protein [Ignavibacteriales bacterium]